MKHELIARIQECIDAGDFPSTLDAPVACRMLIMGVLGVAAMQLSDRLGPPEQADVLARDVLNTLLCGLKSGVSLQSRDPLCAVDEAASRATVS